MIFPSANIRHWKYHNCLKTIQTTSTQWKTYTREAGRNYAASNFYEMGSSRSLAPISYIKSMDNSGQWVNFSVVRFP